MPLIDHRSIPEIQMRPGIRGQFLASKEHGATGVCLLANTVDVGAAAPLHKHTVEETMLVLEGTVWVRVGEERYMVGPHHTVIIPPGTPHAWATQDQAWRGCSGPSEVLIPSPMRRIWRGIHPKGVREGDLPWK